MPLWRAVAATGAHLLWRVPANRVLDVERALPDGSWHSRLSAAGDRPAQRDPVRVRVVAYALDDPGRTGAGEDRLVTDLLDHQRYPANELAALYAQRWEEETALDELKTHQRGPKVVLRSRSPEMVAQEVWGMLLVHHAIRTLMHQAALDHRVDPDRVSFIRSLRIVRRQVTSIGQAALPP